MSIYYVRLSKWYPAKPKKGGDPWPTVKDKRNWYETAKMMVDMNSCHGCGKKKMDYRYAYGLHSIPWGYGTDTIYCTKRCLNKN